MTEGKRKFFDRLDRTGRLLENFALVVLLGGLVGVGVAEIVLREIFGRGISWAEEFSRLTVLWLAMIAAIAAARENRHIRIDALGHLLPDILFRATRVLVDLFAAAVCAVIAWHAWRYLQIEIEFEDTVFRETPAWIVHSVVPAAFALTAYRFVLSAAKSALGSDTAQTRTPMP
ncbi:MAG: TRAP transporter small permease [Woeseiaceae bacterium]|nr:TRAP transporter small permease [Woeseiaceae bacterium]